MLEIIEQVRYSDYILCTSQYNSPLPNRGGVGDLAGKVVSFDCKCIPPVIGDFNDIFSFSRDAGTKAGEWI